MNPWKPAIELNPLPAGAEIVAFGHRSGAETHERCPRAYFYQYEYLGHGMNVSPTPLNLRVGSAVHHGLADLLSGEGIDAAVKHSLDYLFDCRSYQTLAQEQQVEQEVLVHGLLYAYWRFAHESVMKRFEVLCVETGAVEYIPVGISTCPSCDGVYCGPDNPCPTCNNTGGVPTQFIAMQSRPDALLRDRATGEVAGWSWKTIDDPTDFRRSQFHNDLQGFMEMWYGERILESLRGAPITREEIKQIMSELAWKTDQSDDGEIVQVIHDIKCLIQELEDRARSARNIPTQVDYIQTVFLVKGKRKLLDPTELPWINSASYSDDDDEYGGYAPGKVYKQQSHLCYRYRNGEQTLEGQVDLYKSGSNKGKPKPGDPLHLADESWAYRFFKPGNESFSSLSSKWLTSPIQPDQVRAWVDKLADGAVYPSTLGDERNPNPLAKIIRFETPLYRDGVKAARHVQQQRDRFVRIAGDMTAMNALFDIPASVDALGDALDERFPQHLINCRTPYRCAYHDFCHTPREAEIDFVNVPDGFEVREPHHPVEREYRHASDNTESKC